MTSGVYLINMVTITQLPPYSSEFILHAFNEQVREWRLDKLLYQLFEGKQQAKCQFGWYLQYTVEPQEIENFMSAFTALEKEIPDSPYIPLVKMVQYLYGLGVTASLEQSRFYLQQFHECYALTTSDLQDEFLQVLVQINHMPSHLRCQWLATQGNGEALCDLAKYYLTQTQENNAAIDLLSMAAEFGHYRALKELAGLYRDGQFIEVDENKANHFSRKAFLRKVILQPDQLWQIKDLPIAGYAERLAEREHSRTYHEVMCMLYPQYDFLFDKHSKLVPLVHTPSSMGVLENIRHIIPYFIEHLIDYDLKELKSPRLREALETLIAEYDLPKLQRDQIHLLLAFQYAKEKNITAAAQHAVAIKQPHVYATVMNQIDPTGILGEVLLRFAENPEFSALNESDALTEYALIYLIACIDTLSASAQELLKNQLIERFPQTHTTHTPLTCESLQQLANWHMHYSQARYALYKIQHHLQHYSHLRWYLNPTYRKRYKLAQEAWHTVLITLSMQNGLAADAVQVIQKTYPVLANALNELTTAPASVLKRLDSISKTLLACHSR